MYTEPLFHKTVAGLKNQTRRLITRSIPINWKPGEWSLVKEYCYGTGKSNFINHNGGMIEVNPRHQPGEVVYLKEPYTFGWTHAENERDLHYKFTATEEEAKIFENDWQNKMFMPAKYARYYQKVISVKVERIADISEEDAIAEGCPGLRCQCMGNRMYCEDCMNTGWQYDPRYEFIQLWNSINAKSWKRHKDDFFAFPFEACDANLKSNRRDRHVIVNPWVFCYELELCDKEGNPIYEENIEQNKQHFQTKTTIQ